MARSRNIKPGFFQNEQLGELEPIARLAFIGMWTVADFKGCLEFRPKRLKIQLLPYDDCDLEKIAINLDKSGLIRLYSIQGNRFIKILKFEEHQNPHKNERDSGSEIPDYDENYREINELQKVDNNREQDGTNRADSLLLIPDSLLLNPETLKPIPDKTNVKQNPLDVCSEEVIKIFEFWKKTMKSPKSELDDTRKRLIKKALKSYSPADVCKAIRGCSKSPHNMGQNESKTKYNGLDLILRNADKIDRFIALDAGNAISSVETFDERNARIEREVMGGVDYPDHNTIDMG